MDGRFERIKVGMSFEEVDTILSSPWFYGRAQRDVGARLYTYTEPDSCFGLGSVIMVTFDRDKLVCEKEIIRHPKQFNWDYAKRYFGI